jgi:hypothetical protein
MPPEDGQELMPKHVGAIINNNIAQLYSNIEVPTRCTCYRVHFYPMIALHVSDIITTHLQEHKTTVFTASGNHYTVTDRVFTVKEYL